MKSKRAKSFIIQKLFYALDPSFPGHRSTYVLGRNNSYKAIELAEQDARERAVRARCETCIWNIDHDNPNNKRCALGRGYTEARCDILTEFMKHYDNDNQ